MGECSVEEWAVEKAVLFLLGLLHLPIAAFVSCL